MSTSDCGSPASSGIPGTRRSAVTTVLAGTALAESIDQVQTWRGSSTGDLFCVYREMLLELLGPSADG